MSNSTIDYGAYAPHVDSEINLAFEDEMYFYWLKTWGHFGADKGENLYRMFILSLHIDFDKRHPFTFGLNILLYT